MLLHIGSLTEEKVVWFEELSMMRVPDGIHSAGLQIYQDGPWHIAAAVHLIVVHLHGIELISVCYFIVVHL